MERITNLHNWMKGKTVKSVDAKSVNCTFIVFTDGTVACLEAEAMGHGIYGPVPYSFTEEEYKKDQKEYKDFKKKRHQEGVQSLKADGDLDERCTCTHLRSEHGPLAGEDGHGTCHDAGCDCDQYTFACFVDKRNGKEV